MTALTTEMLDCLGFAPYWDSNGDSGTRSLLNGEGKVVLWVGEIEENEDGSYGYGVKKYIPHQFTEEGFTGSINTIGELLIYAKSKSPIAYEMLQERVLKLHP